MQPGRFRQLIEGLLHVPLKERDRAFQGEIARILVQTHGRPIGHPPPLEMRLNMATAQAGYSLDSRAKMIYRAATTVLEQSGASPELRLAEEMRAVVRDMIEAQPARLLDSLRARFGDEANAAADGLAAAASDHAKEYEAQIELFVSGLPRPARPTVTRPPNTFNIHGPVGAIQTGEGATAQVTQVNTPPEVLDALVRIAAHFRSLDTDEAREVVAVVEDVRADIQSPTTNRLRLAGAASALGGVVQTVADLQPAFAAVKAFLKTLGIQLP